MKYEYGSKPVNGYDYRCFVKHIAPVLPKDDEVFLYRHSDEWRENPNKIPVVLFKNICHWKSPRRFKNVLINKVSDVNKRWKNALHQLNGSPFQKHAIRSAFKELTSLHGVAVPTASALLTAWNPKQFAIMDFKTLAVLNMPQRKSVKSYVEFRNRLLELRSSEPELHNCALRQIELAIWHYYPIQNADKKKRSDN